VALGVAAVLAVFLLYTSLAGGTTPALRPSQLAGHTGKVQLAGIVLAPVRGDAHAGGLHFRLRDFDGKATVPVVYTGTVPDLFRAGRHILVEGHLRDGVFVSQPGSMITKCPSKYAPKKSSS
jgi:cytochrome c-type biogenesis protein CcmE